MLANGTPTAAASAPVWIAYAGFLISLILGCIKAFEFYRSRTEQTSLSFALTRDAFFRFADFGEALFINAVVFATERPALITDMQGVLRRVDGKKEFTLQFLSFGEPADRGKTIHDHYFFSSGPTDFIPVDVPVRRIYLCVLEGYAQPLQDACRAARTEGHALAPAVRAAFQAQSETGAVPDPSLTDRIEELRNAFMTAYVDGVQLESSKYILELTCKFRDPKRRLRRTRTAVAAAELEILERPKDLVRERMYGFVGSILLEQTESFTYPEVKPQSVRPLDG